MAELSNEDFDDFEDFDELKEIARSITADDRVRHDPPANLWSTIAAGIAEPTETEPAKQPLAKRELGPAQELPGGDPRFSPSLVLAAVAALIVVLIAGSLAIPRLGGDDTTVLAAQIDNTDLPEAFDGTGIVTLELDDDPMLVLELDTELPATENIEIWILSADGTEVIPVGTVEDGVTTWDWPSGFSPVDFPLVDLSIEPDDGDPTHSGRSILRGELMTS